MEVKPQQPLKAFSPKDVILEGSFKQVRPSQPLKAFSSIDVTPEGIVKLVKLLLL